MTAEKEHINILMNVEMNILQHYRNDRTLTSFDIEQIYSACERHFKQKSRGKESKHPNFSEKLNIVFHQTVSLTEVISGHESFKTRKGETVDLHEMEGFESTSPSELVTCFKRLRKSIKHWEKRSGRNGYLKFLDSHFTE